MQHTALNLQRICILGSTGTVGKNTLEVVSHNLQYFKVVTLVANSDVTTMFKQVQQFKPKTVIMADEPAAQQLRQLVISAKLNTKVNCGYQAMCEAVEADDTDIVVAAIVGAAGLLPTLSAAKAGKKILLANKEVLVMAGELFMQVANKAKAQIMPLDSEHNAIFQCLPAGEVNKQEVAKIVLTASGGPLHQTSSSQFLSITPEQACNHPNWVMGKKISVDSATLMNKGLEFIEACWLFSLAPEDIDIVIHPQSIIHSMVHYIDGSVLAQMSNPDMKVPIAHALGWPSRINSGASPLSLVDISRFDFFSPDTIKFPCLKLAQQAAKSGGIATAVLNAANEIAVDAFLENKLRFDLIPEVVDATLQKLPSANMLDIENILDIDKQARSLAHKNINQLQV
jgi:1-deoxy-D-xylulose-5-phosphate reductoisomerase